VLVLPARRCQSACGGPDQQKPVSEMACPHLLGPPVAAGGHSPAPVPAEQPTAAEAASKTISGAGSSSALWLLQGQESRLFADWRSPARNTVSAGVCGCFRRLRLAGMVFRKQRLLASRSHRLLLAAWAGRLGGPRPGLRRPQAAQSPRPSPALVDPSQRLPLLAAMIRPTALPPGLQHYVFRSFQPAFLRLQGQPASELVCGTWSSRSEVPFPAFRAIGVALGAAGSGRKAAFNFFFYQGQPWPA